MSTGVALKKGLEGALYVTYLHQSKISEWLSSVRRTLTMVIDQSH
jgi:hypothetical protein